MWEFMNDVADGMRRRWMPRRRNGINTMTAMIVGASVGIAAWEALRRSRMVNFDGRVDAAHVADQVMEAMTD